MKYNCTNCNLSFEPENKKNIRCPKCMGIHDIEPVKEQNAPRHPLKRNIIILCLFFIVAGIAIYLLGEAEKEAPVKVSDSLTAILKKVGLTEQDAIEPFLHNNTLTTLAKKITEKASPSEYLKVLYEHLNKGFEQGKWTKADQSQPATRQPYTALEIAEKFQENEVPKLTSFEISSFLLACTKALEIKNTHMVEIYYYKGQKIPADPSATYGHFAILKKDKTDDQSYIYDTFSRKQGKANIAQFNILNDQEATAHYYGHMSQAYFATMDLKSALDYNEVAMHLDPENPAFKMQKGKVFLASGAIQEALTEFEKAKKSSNWATTKVALAQVSLISGANSADIEANLRSALNEFPHYHQARVLLASIFLSRGDTEAGREELEIAQSQSPKSFEVATAFAQLYMMERETEKAIKMAQKAVVYSNENFQTLLLLAQIYQATANFSQMRQTAQKAMDQAPSEEVKSQIKELFRLTDSELLTSSDKIISEETEESEESKSEDIADSLPSTSGLKLKLQDPSIGGRELRLGTQEQGDQGGLRLQLKHSD